MEGESLLELFSACGSSEADFRKIDNLTLDIEYDVMGFQLKTTIHGKGLQVTLIDPNNGKPFSCFMPKRFISLIKTEEDLYKINAGVKKIIFRGRICNRAILEFVK